MAGCDSAACTSRGSPQPVFRRQLPTENTVFGISSATGRPLVAEDRHHLVISPDPNSLHFRRSWKCFSTNLSRMPRWSCSRHFDGRPNGEGAFGWCQVAHRTGRQGAVSPSAVEVCGSTSRVELLAKPNPPLTKGSS